MDDNKELLARIERLEERLQGLLIFLGIQGAMQDWPDIDFGDDNLLKTAAKNALQLDHRPNALGNAGLAHQAVVTILAAQGARKAVQQLSGE